MGILEEIEGKLEDYAGVVGPEIINELVEYAKNSGTKRVFMVNSTKDGGGVAVLLNSIVPIMNNLGIETHWLDIRANPSFFATTKSFHNGLQGEKIDDPNQKIQDYMNFYENELESFNAHVLEHLNNLREGDVVVIHDPQPLGLIKYRRDDGSKWIWRCHIDTSNPNEEMWNFVHAMAEQYDARIVSKKEFMHGDLDWDIIPPSIDPLVTKNKKLDDEKVDEILDKYNIPKNKPFISQVSRFDKWKDPVGVIEAFRKAHKEVDCSLVLVYDGASDDPEGDMMYKLVKDAIDGEYSEDIHLVRGDREDVVNTFQSKATVVLQKSLREGFALTVSEALWKATPVIATRIGGIPLQVVDDYNGYLVEPYSYGVFDEVREKHINDTAEKIVSILSDEQKARKMSENAKKHVMENFLVTRHVKDYLQLFIKLTQKEKPVLVETERS